MRLWEGAGAGERRPRLPLALPAVAGVRRVVRRRATGPPAPLLVRGLERLPSPPVCAARSTAGEALGHPRLSFP